jgi:hypothetical protein
VISSIYISSAAGAIGTVCCAVRREQKRTSLDHDVKALFASSSVLPFLSILDQPL